MGCAASVSRAPKPNIVPTYVGTAEPVATGQPLKGGLGFDSHRCIAPQTRRDPAPSQPTQQGRCPAPSPTQHTLGIAQRAAAVKPLHFIPAHSIAGAHALAREHLPERTGLNQAADTATIARRTERGLGRRFGVDVNNLRRHSRLTSDFYGLTKSHFFRDALHNWRADDLT